MDDGPLGLDSFGGILAGLGATGGGILVGGGIVLVSSLNGSGYPVKINIKTTIFLGIN